MVEGVGSAGAAENILSELAVGDSEVFAGGVRGGV
jgi:hypothetical protein